MKPWEETWEPPGEITAVLHDNRCLWSPGLGYRDSDMARMQLASAAPEMARALLAVEWGGERMGEPCCVGCGASARYGISEVFEKSKEAHASDCVIDAALRKAGVRG